MSATYVQGADLPDLEIAWSDSNGHLIDFSSGWTFSVLVGKAGKAAEFEKTEDITGAATDPNVLIAWADTEINSLAAGAWSVLVKATRAADGKQRRMKATIFVVPGVSDPA